MTFLSPDILVRNIPTIAIVISAVILVIVSQWMDRKVVFPLADSVKRQANKRIKKGIVTTLFMDGTATTIFLAYCYFTTDVLAKYVFIPVLREMKEFLLVVVVVLFLILSYIINNRDTRRAFLHA